MASALLASQAVLGVLIGWFTFAGHSPATTTAAEPDLGPALVVPPATVKPVLPTEPGKAAAHPNALPVPSSTSAVPSSEPPAATMVLPPSASPTPPPSPPPSTPVSPQPPEGSTSASPTTGPAQQRATPVATSTVAENVTVGDKCDQEDADGRTPAAVLVRCLLNRSGNLVWQII